MDSRIQREFRSRPILIKIIYFPKVLMESEQLRKENDTSGPQDELEYWKKRGAQFSQLLAHLEVCPFAFSI